MNWAPHINCGPTHPWKLWADVRRASPQVPGQGAPGNSGALFSIALTQWRQNASSAVAFWGRNGTIRGWLVSEGCCVVSSRYVSRGAKPMTEMYAQGDLLIE